MVSTVRSIYVMLLLSTTFTFTVYFTVTLLIYG